MQATYVNSVVFLKQDVFLLWKKRTLRFHASFLGNEIHMRSNMGSCVFFVRSNRCALFMKLYSGKRGKAMSVYKKMYLRLFAQVTDAIEELEAGSAAEAFERLKQAQRETEEMYINEESSEN